MAAGELNDIHRVIQLAIAPVFLLTSVGTILTLLNTRLTRVVDRTRVLASRRDGATEDKRARIETELRLLGSRRRLINAAITSGTVAALLVCVLIAVAFIGALAEVGTGAALATLFVLVMFAFVAALLLFLREVMIASSATDVELH